MSDMQADKNNREDLDVRAADPEEGITSYQTAHAWEESLAEGERSDETPEDLAQ